jgi:hypothetical protein
MTILNEGSHSDVIEWLPDGNGFVVKDKKRCLDEVLTVYFGLSKYPSFTRRLKRWAFVHHQRSRKTACYFHPLFRKSYLAHCLEMRCNPQKKYGAKKHSSNHKNGNKGGSSEHTHTNQSVVNTFRPTICRPPHLPHAPTVAPTQIQHPALFVRDRNCSRGTTIQPFPDHYNNSGATNVETRFAGTYVGSELNPDLYFQNGEYPLPRPLAAAHSPSNTFLRIHNQYLPQVAQSNDGRHSHGYQRRVAPPDVYNNEINSTFHVRPSADMIRLVDHSSYPDQRRIL